MLLDSSVITQSWKHSVAACLHGLTLQLDEHLTSEDAEELLAAFHALRGSESRTDSDLFRTRLGLAVADLAAGHYPVQADELHAALIRSAQEGGDAFSAKDLLSHPESRGQMTPRETDALTRLVNEAGLGHGPTPQPLLSDLGAAIEGAESPGLTRSQVVR